MRAGVIMRGLVLQAIVTCPCPKQRDERVSIALNCGIITDDEAVDLRAKVPA